MTRSGPTSLPVPFVQVYLEGLLGVRTGDPLVDTDILPGTGNGGRDGGGQTDPVTHVWVGSSYFPGVVQIVGRASPHTTFRVC